MNIEGARTLVVGGAGFVGSNLVRRLLDMGAEDLLVVDNFLSSEPDNIPVHERVSVLKASINDVIEGLDRDGFDYVFHLATFHGNQSSIADPLQDHQNNLLPTLRLSHAFSGSRRLRRLVYASAGCTVAAKTAGAPEATDESSPISAYHDSPYQISKVVGEFYLNYFWASQGLPAVKARFQNVYGPGEVLGAGQWRGTPATVWRNVVPTFIYRAINGLPLVLHNDGQTSRDFIFVDDIVEGLVLCAVRGEPGEVYNLASGVETPIKRVAEIIAQNVDRDVSVESLPGRAWDHSGRRFGSTVKARKLLGFTANVGLEVGIRTTIDWTLMNIDRIDHAMRRHDDRMKAFSSQPN